LTAYEEAVFNFMTWQNKKDFNKKTR